MIERTNVTGQTMTFDKPADALSFAIGSDPIRKQGFIYLALVLLDKGVLSEREIGGLCEMLDYSYATYKAIE
jgi:hypothetical protein